LFASTERAVTSAATRPQKQKYELYYDTYPLGTGGQGAAAAGSSLRKRGSGWDAGCWGWRGRESAPLHPFLMAPRTPKQQLLSPQEPRARFTSHQPGLGLKL